MRPLAILVTVVVAASMAVGSAAPAFAVKPPPPLYFVIVQDSGFGKCVPLAYGDGPAQLNQYMNWRDTWPDDVTVVEVHGFWSFAMSEDDSVDRQMTEAGTFRQNCGGPGDDLSVAPTAPISTSNPNFGIRWATPRSPAEHVYSVEYKVGLHGVETLWRTENAQKAAVFPGHHGHAYFFRAAVFIDHDHHAGWSPWIRVVVH